MRLRGRIKKWLYGHVPGFSGRFPYFGTMVYFPKNCHLFDRACSSGIYEFELVSLLWKLVEPETYYFDVGANIGLMSAPVLQSIPDCRVVSFEPSPNALPYLRRTVSESPYRDRWTVVGQALGAACGTVSFCVNDPSYGAFDGLHDTGRVTAKGTVSVSMTTLDKVWQDLGRPRVSAIKIDVEGSELEVLKGGRNCLANEKPFVLLEWNKTNLQAFQVDPDCLLDFAQSIGYGVFAAKNLMPISNRASMVLLTKLGIENFLMAPESKPVAAKFSGQNMASSENGQGVHWTSRLN